MSTPATTELRVTGMTCNNCARTVTEAVQGIAGVHSATVTLSAKRASVRWDSAEVKNPAAVLAAISQAGFAAKEISPEDAGDTKQSRWQWSLILGLAVTGALMVGEWIYGLAMTPWFQWAAFALAGVVQIFCGAQFYVGAWRQFKVRESNMDTLVALGSTTAFGYSVWALLSGAGGHVYFMEAAAIISLVSTGHWLEARVSDQAGGALRSLLNLAPQTARRLESAAPAPAKSFDIRSFKPVAAAQMTEIEVPVADLNVDDRIALRPGDRVPVDGVVVEGESTVDEAMLTGESIPADKKTGEELYAGTVNLNGRLVMRVTATGEATALAHIIAAVQRAQTSRADIQRLGDRISNVFVPVIVVIALGAGLWWGFAPASANRVHDFLAQYFWHAQAPAGIAAGFIIAAAVLIVACPCAMGLATPAAIMASANSAARRGILIRDGVALEKAGSITAVIFDKTGTLTMGKPEVAMMTQVPPHAEPLPDEAATAAMAGEEKEIAQLAAALARSSTHPVSRAVARLASENIEFKDWQEIRGAGVEGIFVPQPSAASHRPARPLWDRSGPGERGQHARLGSLSWLKECGVDLAGGEKFVAEWSGQGATIVGLAVDWKLRGLFAVRDMVKAHAVNVVEQLQRQGLKTYLVTGDNALTAAGVAKQMGIAPENVFAGVLPEKKAKFVKKLQAQGERVAFVGDGINDAPALTQADLGIAVSRASDVAREAADIILLKSEIEAVPEALGLARATLRTIKQNLFWAFFYNSIGVPLAAMGFISPIICAAAMGFSDLIVIGNALCLLRWRQK
jgi:Cu+-exporting ATPase